MARNHVDREPKNVQVLSRALSIIECMASQNKPVTLHEVAVATGLHPSTAHRLLWNLSADDYVERDEDGKWRLGLKHLILGSLVRDRIEVREKALPMMQLLYEKTGQTVNLSIRRGDFMMYIEHVYSPQSGVRITRQVGTQVPLHCTSGGKLFLSEFSPEEISAYIARTKLSPRTSHSITIPEQFIVALNKARELGWADDDEELENGIRCIGAPVRNSAGAITAAITVICSTDMAKKPEWVQHLLTASSAVSASLGWLGGQK